MWGYHPSDGVEIESVIAQGRQDQLATAGANGDRKEGKGAFAGDAFGTGTEENTRSKINNFAGAEADEDFVGANVETSGENLTKTLAAPIGVPVGFAESAARGFHGFGRGTEGIFVGSELDGVDFEVLFDFFDGLSRDVGRQALNIIGDEFF